MIGSNQNIINSNIFLIYTRLMIYHFFETISGIVMNYLKDISNYQIMGHPF